MRHRVKQDRLSLAQAVAAGHHFETARWMGPRVYIDTVPLVANALLVVLVASALVFAPATAACDSTLLLYARGQLALSYALLAFMAAATLWPGATMRITALYRLLLIWLGGSVAWATVGLGALGAAESACRSGSTQSAITYYFVMAQVIVHMGLPGVLLARAVVMEPCHRIASCCRSRQKGRAPLPLA
jgi:hypothetical protein